MLEDLVLNRDTLVTVFEDMFGNNSMTMNENVNSSQVKFKSKRYSGLFDNSQSYLTNITRDQTEEMERVNKIMNEPIESLLHNMSNYTYSTKASAIRGNARMN